MIAAGRHTVLYALAEAQLVAFEIAAACAAGIRPFGEKGDAEFVGNVVYIGRTHADLEHIDQRLGPWCKDGHRLVHRFELAQPVDLVEMVQTYRPALVVYDLTQWSTPYQPNAGDERLVWLQGAKQVAIDHDCAVLTAISVEPRFSWINTGPGAPPRHRKVAQPWDLARNADTLLDFNDDSFVLSGAGKSISLTHEKSRDDRRYFHLVIRPTADSYQPQDIEPPRESFAYGSRGTQGIER